MERVVTINLNGNAYQLEEPAYDALRAYLARAEAALAANPDKAEILGDLEQAIADKCAAHLSRTKTVVSAVEMSKALEEMGAVEGESSAGAEDDGAATAAAPKKRLYRLREPAQIAGVCAGLGAYFDIDVRALRFMFLLAAALTWGVFALVYTVMMFLIPTAKTNEEWAAAYGAPYSAQDVIERARREQAFETDESWRWSRRWRRTRRMFSGRWREGEPWRDSMYAAPAAPAAPASAAGAVFAGIVALGLGLVQAAFSIAVLCLLYMLITTGSIGDWRPHDADYWRTQFSDGVIWPPIEWWPVIFLLIVFSIATRTLRWAAYGRYRQYRAGEGLVTLCALTLFVWIAWYNVPEARGVMENIADALAQFGLQLRDAFRGAGG